MRNDRVHHERNLTEAQWFWFIALIGALTRFPLLHLFKAENTDAILNLTYFTSSSINPKNFYILPGYPFLLRLSAWFGWDSVLWGRIVASLAGVIFLFPLWNLARKWVKSETASMVCLMGLFSPLLWVWSLKVMGDTLFLMAFMFCLERLGAVWMGSKKGRPWAQACFWGAVASLVRPEGFIVFPWLVFAGEKYGYSNRILHRAWILLCWAFPFYLLAPRVDLLSQAYREGMGMTTGAGTVDFPLLNFIGHLFVYMTQPIFVLTPILFVIAILGLYRMLREDGPRGRFIRHVLLPVFFVLLFSRLIPTTYQDRHMLVFLPLFLLAAGVEFDAFFSDWSHRFNPFQMMLWRNGLLVICLTYEAVFSSVTIVAACDSFGDIKRSAEFLSTLSRDAVIYSDEIPKTQYWAGRTVRPINYSQEPFAPHVGDYVVLHSFYSPRIVVLDRNLRERFGAVGVRSESSMVVPLLTDLMQDTSLQNRMGATAFRFQPQFFQSIVYEIKGLKLPSAGKKRTS